MPDWLPKTDGASVYQEFFLLLEGDDVRGAYVLKHQDATLGGETHRIGSFYLPLSEAIINPAYALVAPQLVRDAARREPLLYGLGMGGRDTPMARLLRAMRWPMQVVPFYFKVLNGSRFLREIRYVRRGRLTAALLDLAGSSGLGALAARGADWLLTKRRAQTGVHAEPVETCGEWVDELWRSCAPRYAFAAVRDAATLNQVYPQGARHVLLLRISRAGRAIGCAVVRDAQASGNKYFGGLRVGILVDGVGAPDDAEAVVGRAARELDARGADVLVSNQTHPAWCAALRRAGFIRGPSNVLFAASPPLSQRLQAFDPHWRGLHVTRGDGDIPWPGDRSAHAAAALAETRL